MTPLVLPVFFPLQGELAFTRGGNKLLATPLREVEAKMEGRAVSMCGLGLIPSPLWPSPGR